MNEDQLAKEMVRVWIDSDIESEINLEVGYNNYGDRGVVDIHYRNQWDEIVFELKSPSAVRESTGANEIIRQFNRHCKHFYPGSDYTPRRDRITFELSFLATEETATHVHEYLDLYDQCMKNAAPQMNRSIGTSTRLTFRHPENMTGVLVLTDSSDFRDDSFATYPSYVQEANGRVWNAISDTPFGDY